MNTIKTEAVVLRARRYSESSLVVTLLGREYGRLDALAKGARREKSPLFGHLDLYQKEDVLLYRRPQAGLDLLVEAAFVDEHAGLRFAPPAFAAAGLLADLALEATLPGEPQTGLYTVFTGALGSLDALGEARARAGLGDGSGFGSAERAILIGRIAKLALMDMLAWLGFGLELGRCVVCGASCEGGRGAALSRRQGGLVCRGCRRRCPDAVPIAPEALAALRDRKPGAERMELSLSRGERRRWLRFLVDYAQHAIEKPLRSAPVLFQMLD